MRFLRETSGGWGIPGGDVMEPEHTSTRLSQRLTDASAEDCYCSLKEIDCADAARMAESVLLRICKEDEWGPNRAEAACALRHLWPAEEVQEAYETLFDDNPHVANSVIEILAGIMDRPAVRMLKVQYLSTDNPRLRYSILQAFRASPAERVGDFVLAVESYEDEDPYVRALTLSLLGETRDRRFLEIYRGCLCDEEERVRAGAVEALSGICTEEELIQMLPEYLNDESNRVRANVLVPLLKAGYRAAERSLREMVEHTSWLFRSSAAYVLGQVEPTPEAMKGLLQLTNDADSLVRSRAVASVASLDRSHP